MLQWIFINISGCQVLWQSKLQTETALSSMEVEVESLASCFCELIPIIGLVDLISQFVGLSQEGQSRCMSPSMKTKLVL